MHAPGGQLVQETETWAATLGGRIVLCDDNGVRASMTAAWLVQMGWEAVVLEDALDQVALETGIRRPKPGIAAAAAREIDARGLKAALESGRAQVVDLALSSDYAKGHIPRAWFAVRARLATSLPKLPAHEVLVFTSPDDTLARLAAPEASELTAAEVRVLAGGTGAWQAAGLPLEAGFTRPADERDDIWLKPYEQHGGKVEDHMQAYLTWEIDLTSAIERDGDHRFRLFPA